MSAVFEDIVAAIGYTPLVRINKLGSGKAEILAKLESKNPCGSVKDRIAKYMIEAAEEQGLIKANTILVDRRAAHGIGWQSSAKGIGLILTIRIDERRGETHRFSPESF
jgi:cysteine synthase